MRLFFSLVVLLLPAGNMYSQDGPAVQFNANARYDIIGLRNHDYRKYVLHHGEADIAVSLSSENLGLFNGGELYVQIMGVFGSHASAHYSGDLQVFSNIESDTRISLYQCYYKQSFNKLIIKLGQLDVNSDFLVSTWASPMINSSFGVIPTISQNMPASIFSYLAPGASFKYLYSKQLSFQTAFIAGNPGSFETNPHNLNWNLNRNAGWFNIAEFKYKTKSDLRFGSYKAGFFYHSKETGGKVPSRSSKGNAGLYFLGDQQLTFEKGTLKNGLSMFFQISYSPAPQNMIGSYYGFGLIYRGAIPRMNEDELTVALASAKFGKTFLRNNSDYYNNETAIELTYKKYLTPSIIVQPDFQYIINPGAIKMYNCNVVVGLLRMIISV